MTPPAAVQRPSAGPASPQLRSRRTPLLLTVLALAGVLLVTQLLASPHFVSHITFDNPTPYNLSVEVSNGTDGWLPLGSLEPRRATSVGQVYDIGDIWLVRVSAQGETVGQFRVTRKPAGALELARRDPPPHRGRSRSGGRPAPAVGTAPRVRSRRPLEGAKAGERPSQPRTRRAAATTATCPALHLPAHHIGAPGNVAASGRFPDLARPTVGRSAPRDKRRLGCFRPHCRGPFKPRAEKL